MRDRLPERFDAAPLPIRETAFARRSTDFTNRETDDAAADRADGMVIEHALKVAGIAPKEVAHALKLHESAVRQWFIGKARAPIGRISVHFPMFEFAYLQTRAAQSEHLEVALTIRRRQAS